jgi:uncharacterized membrane protein
MAKDSQSTSDDLLSERRGLQMKDKAVEQQHKDLSSMIGITSWYRAVMKQQQYDTTLALLYMAMTYCCIAMVVWILIVPGSWLIGRTHFHTNIWLPLMERLPATRYIPTHLFTKYQGHTAVHVTHMLPSAVWSALLPFQVHPTWRNRHRQLHRIMGYLFLVSCFLIALGVGVIVQRKLIFVHSFPDTNYPAPQHRVVPDIHEVTVLFLALYFILSVIQAIRMARAGHIPLHQRWMIRHVASGIWVAVQRFGVIPLYSSIASFLWYPNSDDVVVPSWYQRKLFGDSSLIAVLVTFVLGEYAVYQIESQQRRRLKSKAN